MFSQQIMGNLNPNKLNHLFFFSLPKNPKIHSKCHAFAVKSLSLDLAEFIKIYVS